ncbi:MAG: hypothetical protein HC836_15730 [Richelia sp. RM2_1_2]|nr:hypothetical protein [Richelia sp. RM2_1_2]
MINTILKPLDEFLLSVERDTDTGFYFITMGIPANWVYKSTNIIECEVLHETDGGSLVKIYPLNESAVIDDLIEFGRIIIETNERIAKMQEEFDNKMKEMKEQLIEQQKLFMDELDEMKDKSFHEIEEKVSKVGEAGDDENEVKTKIYNNIV